MCAAAFVGRLDPAVGPMFAEEKVEPLSEGGQIRSDRNLIKPQASIAKHGPGGQLPMNILEQVLHGDRLGLALLMSSDITTNDLHHVIKQQAERELEDSRFGSAPDEAAQMKDFGNFLKYLFDAPALQVVSEQSRGRVTVVIQKIRDQDDVRLAGSLQRDLANVAAFGMTRRSKPAPFLEKVSALSIDA